MGATFQLLFMTHKDPKLEHFPLKVAPVHFFLQDRLVQMLKFLHRKFFGEKGKANWEVIHLVSDIADGFLNDIFMVKDEIGQLMQREPVD